MDRIITYGRLGICNLLRVGIYRLFLKMRIHSVQRIESRTIKGNFFYIPKTLLVTNYKNLYPFDEIVQGFRPFSGNLIKFHSDMPNWHKNYFNNHESDFRNYNWWEIPDFESKLGDIKTVWELSRFDWVVQLAMLSASGNLEATVLLNARLNNWLKENPPYKGANWKCGQEASIRVMHLIAAAMILDQMNLPSPQLISLIEMHIKRIAPTISYAIGQNNNHGTSEAAALFVGGNFLSSKGLKNYSNYEKVGRKWLENRAKVLFSIDGCFSQYSVNYHRMALDTYSFCESYRRKYNIIPFSNRLITKIQSATRWLEVLTDIDSGDVPNIGANDGARLFPFFNISYRDFRQSVQWANLVFNNRLIYKLPEYQLNLYKQLGLKPDLALKGVPSNNEVIMGKEDGFFIHKVDSLLLVLRRPRYKFRPGQSDALHFDLWINGKNLLRDGGSFSYNFSDNITEYYNGVNSHNTVMIDNRDQMPRYGKFLLGHWLEEIFFFFSFREKTFELSSTYVDYKRVVHSRQIKYGINTIEVRDIVTGYKSNAVLNWRLIPDSYTLNFDENESNIQIIDFKNKILSGNFSFLKGFESRFYFNEQEVSIIHNRLKEGTEFVTKIFW